MASSKEKDLADNAPTQSFLGEKLGKEMVTIYVGPKRKEFMIHKKLICESDFFKGAFMSSFTEAQDGTMYLPDENPAAFDLYIEWAYRKRIPDGHSESYLYSLYDLYIMADKFCNIDLKDLVMDNIQNLAEEHELLDTLFPKDFVLKVYENTTDNSEGLAYFLVEMMSYAFISRLKDASVDGAKGIPIENFQDDDLSLILDLGKRNKALFFLIQNRILVGLRIDGELSDPRLRDEGNSVDRCFFHTHGKDHNCRPLTGGESHPFNFDITQKDHRHLNIQVTSLPKMIPESKRYTISELFWRKKSWLLHNQRWLWSLNCPVLITFVSIHTDKGVVICKPPGLGELAFDRLYTQFDTLESCQEFVLLMKATNQSIIIVSEPKYQFEHRFSEVRKCSKRIITL